MTETTSRRWRLMSDALAGAAANPHAPAARQRFNPRPAGVTLPGGTPDLVLRWLSDRPGAQFRLDTVARAVGKPSKTVSWSLVWLRAKGLVERRFVAPNVAVWWVPAALAPDPDASRARPPEPMHLGKP